jgi:hypothetical protein
MRGPLVTMVGGTVLLFVGLLCSGVVIYAVLLSALETSCLGGQGRGPCEVASGTLVFLLVALVAAVAAFGAGAALMRKGARDARSADARALMRDGWPDDDE